MSLAKSEQIALTPIFPIISMKDYILGKMNWVNLSPRYTISEPREVHKLPSIAIDDKWQAILLLLTVFQLFSNVPIEPNYSKNKTV